MSNYRIEMGGDTWDFTADHVEWKPAGPTRAALVVARFPSPPPPWHVPGSSLDCEVRLNSAVVRRDHRRSIVMRSCRLIITSKNCPETVSLVEE